MAQSPYPTPPWMNYSYKPLDYSAYLQQQPQQAQAQVPAQQKPNVGIGNIAEIISGLGGSSGAYSAMSGPGSYAASLQGSMGPLADFGLASSSPASGAMAEIAASQTGIPLNAMGAAPGYAYALPAIAAVLGGRYGLRALQGKAKNWKDSSIADKAGRVTLGIATGGISEVANKFLGGKSTKDIQRGRWNALLKKGYTGVEDFHNQLGKDNSWTNDKFASSRNEADLKPEDIWGSADVIGAAGNDYFGKWNEGQRRQFSQELLDRKLVDERKGGIYVDDAKAADIAKQISAGTFGASAPLSAQSAPSQSTVDAGTAKRWRESRGKPGYSGVMIPKTGR